MSVEVPLSSTAPVEVCAVEARTTRIADREIPRTAAIGLLLCIVAIWMLEHPYAGLVHDSVLYAFGAFARLHPASLGHDLFLGRGSQNDYTVFSPLVAPLMRILGVARTAALVTLIGQALFFGSCALLARKMMPSALAWLAVALVVALPSLYGGQHVFWFTENFMTPRVPAQALVMISIWCALGRRFGLMGLCIAAAMLLHPIMGLAGFVLLYWLIVGARRPWLTVGLAAGGLAALALVSRIAPFGPIATLDAGWFNLLHGRLEYLFPSLWSAKAWGRMAVPAATLVVGAVILEPGRTRLLCRTGLATGMLGLAVAMSGADLLHIVIVAQVQPWRWLWLTNALAMLLLPVIATRGWSAGPAGRAAVLLAVAAWISFDQPFGGFVALLAVGAAALARLAPDARENRLLIMSAPFILLACLGVLVESVLIALSHEPSAPAAMSLSRSMFWAVSRWRPWASGGVAPLGGFLLLWWVARRRTVRRGLAGLAPILVGGALCAALAPYTWSCWTSLAPSNQMQARFAPWRRAIAPTAEVLAPGVPIIPWFLLERPSYWSLRQMAGSVFSRPTAMRLLKREALLNRLPATRHPGRDLDVLCAAARGLGFIVTPVDMGPTPFKPMVIDGSKSGTAFHLYSCAGQRGRASRAGASAPVRR
jgi:hypothetical protein